MRHRWKTGLGGVLAALLMTSSAGAVGGTIEIDGTALSPSEAWMEDGTSYVTLAAFCRETDRTLTWQGSSAQVSGGGLELEAAFGAPYVLSNGRALYLEEVQVVDGRTVLPLRVLANASGAQLTWDGGTSTASLDTRESVPPQAAYNQEDLYWLARIISAESKGEPLLGQIAVGNVVLNRVRSPEFPDTVKEVVFDRENGVQFTPVVNGAIYQEPVPSAVLAAKLCLEGTSVVGDSLYFFAPAVSAGSWIVRNRPYYTTIGSHSFYQ